MNLGKARANLGKARANQGKSKASAASVVGWIVIALLALLTLVWTIWASHQPEAGSIWRQD